MSDEDLLSALASLPSGVYTPQDRYQDFRQLFTTDQGKRVLREILGWGHLLSPSVHGSPIDPYLTHIREGEANIARRLLVTVMREPQQPQQQQTRKR